MSEPAMLISVGTNNDESFQRKRGWIVVNSEGRVLRFVPSGEDGLRKLELMQLPCTPLIRITTTQYYELLQLTPEGNGSG